MCSGIEYQDQLLLWRDAEVRLPVQLADGGVTWRRWGERHGVAGAFVQGPCARLESIREGRWARFDPRPVEIPLQRYMERDAKGAPYWVRVDSCEVLQGLLATVGDDQRVYVVTVPSPGPYRHVQPRWPRVLGTS